MYKNATYLMGTCANPTPVTCNTAVSYGEALAHDQAYPGDPLDPARLVGQPDHGPRLLQQLLRQRRLGLLPAAGAQQRPRKPEGPCGLERRPVRPQRPRLLQQQRHADLRHRRLTGLPDQLQLADRDEGAARRDRRAASDRRASTSPATPRSSATPTARSRAPGGRASPPTSTASSRSSSR